MIASVRGELRERGDGWCVIEAGGVGYLLQVSTPTLAALPGAGREVRLLTRQVVREDSLQLFGFAEPPELRVFDLLIAVNGVGPKLALAALSGLPPAALARAIRDENVAALVAVPGIGRKTAERLVVELRDKLDFLPLAPAPAAGERPRRGVLPDAARFDDAVAALVTLGYAPAQAQDAVRHAAGEAGEAGAGGVEAILRRALARLARPAAVAR